MKRALLILLLCMGTLTSPAQQYFNVRNPLRSFTSILTSVVPYNGKYYCTGPCIDSINYIGNGLAKAISGIKFAVFDAYGNKLLDTVYQEAYKDLDPWSNNLHQLADKSFVLASEEYDTGDVAKVRIVNIDTLGNVLWTKTIDKPLCTAFDDYWIKVTDLQPAENGNWLMLSRISCRLIPNFFNLDVLLTKLDSGFNVVWHKSYGVDNMDDGAWKLLIESDGYTISAGRDNTSQKQKKFSLRAMLLKTDFDGNLLWSWLSDPYKRTGEAKDIIRTKDGGYVYCGTGDGQERVSANGDHGIPVFKAWVEKLDSNRNVVWSRSFGQYYYNEEFKRVIEGPDGRLFLFGNKFLPDSLSPDNALIHTRGWFMTLSADGDSLSERIYYNLNTCRDQHYFYDAKATEDGGFVLCGQVLDECLGYIPPMQRGWLVKVDSNGCLGPGDPQCWPTGVPKDLYATKVTVYPNPVKDYCNIKNTQELKLEISVMDITGRLLTRHSSSSSAIKLDFANYAPGVYLYRISEKGGVLLQGKVLKE